MQATRQVYVSDQSIGSRRSGRFAGLLRDPLMPFLLIGALFFAGYYAVESARSEPVRFTPEVEAAMAEEFETLTGRKPTAEDRARIKQDFFTRELLFRDAIDRNLHLTSPEAREVLIDKERYLIAGAPKEPTESEMVDFYSEHFARYQSEPRTNFTQVFRTEPPADLPGTLAALNAGKRVASDDFWLGLSFPHYGDSMLRGIFGQPFVDGLKAAPEGEWIGPLQSSRGWHFIRVSARKPAERMPYAVVRDQLRQDVMDSRTSTALDTAIGELKEKYDVVDD